MYQVGDSVETIKGVGVIIDVRDHRIQGGDLCYLICLGRKGFPSDSDIFTHDEVCDIF